MPSTTATTAGDEPTFLDTVTHMVGERQREIYLLMTLFACAFSMVAMMGYSPADPTLLHPGEGLIENPCGPVGALLADALFAGVGYGAWGLFAVMVLSVRALAGREVRLLSATGLAAFALYWVSLASLQLLPLRSAYFDAGGMVGRWTGELLQSLLGTAGAGMVLFSAAFILVTVIGRIRWSIVAGMAWEQIEIWAPVARKHLGAWAHQGWLLFRAAGAAVANRAWNTVRRMGHSLLRGVEQEHHDYPLDDFGGDPDSFAPASDPTQMSRPVAVVEVEWEPTNEVSMHDKHLMEMFPDMAPRPTGIDEDPDTMKAPTHNTPTVAQERQEAPPVPDTPAAAPLRMPVPQLQRPSVDADPPTPLSQPSYAPPTPVPAAVAMVPAAAPAQEPDSSISVGARAAHVAGPAAQVKMGQGLNVEARDDGGEVKRKAAKRRKRKPATKEFQLPPVKLLDIAPTQRANYDREELQKMARTIEDTLQSFRIDGHITDVRVGPVVTIFEFLPAAGVPISKVANKADDLCMRLAVRSVRIVAPIPGKGVVGIEVPSKHRLTIFLREVLASPEFRESDMALPCVLGKDVEGCAVVADLAKMPHGLVGGTTGSGKSVGVNGILMSLLFTQTPDELRVLLVDPKKLEFKLYEDIPHLLHPVVTEPRMAAAALAWACREMDQRYELLAGWDTRNIANYNAKVERELKSWTAEKAEKYRPSFWPETEHYIPEKLPYIVIVIDELSDLMMVAKKEVEESIVRLAQMARACGIHLILATQRPSADVLTGLIKSNMPTRMAFKLRSGIDSRIVLDEKGAERLLGKGDMLYLPNTGDLKRVHGAFVSDEEVGRVTDFLKEQAEPEYIEAVCDDGNGPDEAILEEPKDQYFDDAVELVRAKQKASASMIQRQFKIGYNRATRIIEYMEAMGLVGPADGARPREVLLDPPE